MLDIKLFRTDPEAVKAAIARRGDDTSAVDRVVERTTIKARRPRWDELAVSAFR